MIKFKSLTPIVFCNLLILFLSYSYCKGQNIPQLQSLNDLTINEGDTYEFFFQASDNDELNKIENPRIVIIGSSTANGTGASSQDKQWVSLFEQYLQDNTSNYQLFKQTKGGYTSYHFRENGFVPLLADRPLPDESINITSAILNNPDLIIVNLPSNDVSRGFGNQETYDNFHIFKSLTEAADSRIIFHTNQPVNYSSLSQRQQLFGKAEYIKANFGPDVIETYDLLADPLTFRIKDEYNRDGTHVNDAGHKIIFEQTVKTLEQYILGDNIIFEVTGLPSFAEYEYMSDGRGKITFSPGFSSSGIYTINVSAIDLQGNRTSQSFNLTIDNKEPLGGTQRLESFNHTINNGGLLNYYIYFPEDYDFQPDNQPVLISLHGLGERDGDPSKMLGTRYGDGSHAFLANRGYNFPLMIVSPHQQRNVGGTNYNIWNADLVKQLIDHIILSYNVDPTRIYLTGFSNGGQAVWNYATKYPQTIAALVPMAGRTPTSIRNNACNISGIPTRAFHGEIDNIINRSETIGMVNIINNCNPTPNPLVELNIISGVNHDDLRPLIYENISGNGNIYDWMLAYEKGGIIVDNSPPAFLNNTPEAKNILDTSFDLEVQLNERGNIYVVAYNNNNYIPSSEEVKSGSGNDLLFSNATLSTNSFTFSYNELDFDTEYNFWVVAEDDAQPINLQSLPTQITIRTQPEILDLQAPIFEEIPFISTISAGGFSANIDLDEEGTIFWGVYPSNQTTNPADLISGTNSIQRGESITDGSITTINIESLFKNSDYTLALLAQDDEENPNVQENITYLNIRTLEFDEGVIPNKVYKINATNSNTTSGLSDWNDINFVASGATNNSIFDTDGNTSTISITTYNGTNNSLYNNVADNGSNYGGNIMPPSIIRYAAFTTGIGKMDMNGLDPNKFYTLKLLGSRSGSGSRLTRFSANGLSQQLEAINNKDNLASYDKISPNSLGRLNIEFTKVNSSWGYFNGMIIEEFNKLTGDITAPGSVTNLVTEFDENSNAVNLIWTASPDIDVTSYTIFRSENPVIAIHDFNKIVGSNISNTSFSDVNVEDNSTYYYWVIALDGAGNYSEFSEPSEVVIGEQEPDLIAPLAPTGLTTQNISGNAIALSWNPNTESDLEGYYLYRSESPGFDIQPSLRIGDIIALNTLEDIGLNDGQLYYYKLTALDRSGNESIASNELTVLTIDITPPLAPEVISLTPSANDISIEWSPSTSTDVDIYEIYRIDTIEQEVATASLQNPIEAVTKSIYLSLENNASDDSGNSVNSSPRNGTSFSSTIFYEGEFSVFFDGVNDFIDIDVGNQFIHNQFNQRTISFWIYPETTSGIRDIFDEGGSTNGIGLRINNGKIEAAVQNQQVIRTISADINANEWTQIVLVFDNGQLSLYLNGQLASNESNIPFVRIDTHGNGSGLGGTNGSNAFDIVNSPFQGFIDEFIITGTAWDTNFISSYFNYYNPEVVIQPVPVITLIGTVEDNIFNYVDNTVEPEIDYTYFVKAIDYLGNSSSESELKTARLVEEILIPEVPEGLFIELVENNQILLQWNEINTAGFRDYSIFRSSSQFFETSSAELIASEITATNYLDVGLESESTYYYAVLATNVLNQSSPLSETVSLTTPDFEPPLSPTEINAIYSEGILTLNWNPSSSIDKSLYKIYRKIGSTPQVSEEFLYQELEASSSAFDDINVDESIAYHYVFTTVDDAGNESMPSEEVQISIPNLTPPSTPTGITLAVDENNNIVVSWNNNTEPDFYFYTVWRSNTSFSDSTDATKLGIVNLPQIIDTELASSTQYFYRVSATDNGGNVSELSLEVSITTEDIEPPATPQGLIASAENNLISISWNPNLEADLASYQLYKGTIADFTISPNNLVSEVLVNQPSESIVPYTLEEEGTTYFFKVVALDFSNNSSIPSPSVRVDIPNETPPSIPSGLTLLLNAANEIKLGWNSVNDNDIFGYNIYRSTENDLVQILNNSIATEISVNEYIDSSLDFNTTYYYVITSIDLAGNESESSEVKFTTTDIESTGVNYLRAFKINVAPSGFNSGLAEWNDLSFNLPNRTTTTYLLQDSTGNSSNIRLEIDNGLQGSFVNAVANNGSSLNGGILPNQVMRYAAYTTGMLSMSLTGLNAENYYKIILHSGRSGSGSRISQWIVQGEEGLIETINNKDNLLEFKDVIPNSSGEISLVLNKVNSNWAYFNGLIIREYTNPNERVTSNLQLDLNESNDNSSYVVELYPNPTSGEIFIRIENFLATRIKVFNQNGKVCQEGDIDTSNAYKINQKAGLYYLQLSNKEGIVYNSKVIIK